MSVIVGDIYSNILEKSVTYCGFFPNHLPKEVSIIYLLHGRGGNAKSFLNQTMLAREIQDTSFIAFSVDVGNAYYVNSDTCGNIQDFISQEFPQMIKNIHPFEVKQEFIIGVSMGGYGALRWVEREPNRFAGIALLSPLLKIKTLLTKIPSSDRELKSIFKDPLDAEINALDILAQCTQTQFYHHCGDNDFMVEDNDDLSKQASETLTQYEFKLWQGGHDWSLWSQQIKDVLNQFNQLSERRVYNGRTNF